MIARLVLAATAAALAAPSPAATLIARAQLPAPAFVIGGATGRPSGHFIGHGPFNGQHPPFPGQTVQGFSGLVALPDGRFLANTDNGFGTLENSADHLLRVYTLRPGWVTAAGGPGTLDAHGSIVLADPDHRVPWTIVHEHAPERWLTGADFDPESLVRTPDGTLWLGDEFGPFVLHFDARGRLLEPPIAVPDPAAPGRLLKSPQNPLYEEATPVRLLDALNAEVEAHGGKRPPICSPDQWLVADGDPATGLGHRRQPPAGSGLRAASSEIFDPPALAAAGFATVPWTVNDPARMRRLIGQGVAGLITDDPGRLYALLAELRVPCFTPEGLVDATRFDLQGHRGARDLRPENTLPSFEAGLDALVSTLETDCHQTRDGVLVLSHDPDLVPAKVRHADGRRLERPIPIRSLTFAELQAGYTADGLLPDRPRQTHDLARSPVAVAFARAHGLRDPYVVPSLDQLFDFVDFYQAYNGKAANDRTVRLRALAARRVGFDLETKVRPTGFGDEPSGDAAGLARALVARIRAHQLAARATIESFDFRALLAVAREAPEIGLVALFADGPVMKNPQLPGSEDGTNLQPTDAHGRSAWLAGYTWPYRRTYRDDPPRVPQSGGLEGLGLAPDGRHLLALLEKPLVGEPARDLWLQELDARTRRWTGRRWRYPLEPRGSSVGDIALVDARHGVALERDTTQGDLQGFKRIYRFTLGAPGTRVTKELVADLLGIADPARLGALRAKPGDVGIGPGPRYAFPYETPEGIAVLDDRHVAVIDDNNYPFGHARHAGTGAPDDDELIVLELSRPLGHVAHPVGLHAAP